METIIYLTFIPWALYFISMSKSALNDLSNNKLTLGWIGRNIFKIFRFDNLILFTIFGYFSYAYPDANQLWLVEIMLFTVINLYLFINRFYDKGRYVGHIEKDDLSVILVILLIMLIPVFYYSSSKDYRFTYYLMFGYGFFNYVIVFVANLVIKMVFKIIGR